jgi:DNA-binding CsgD family transcriptional regulator
MPNCGPGGRGFESRRSPRESRKRAVRSARVAHRMTRTAPPGPDRTLRRTRERTDRSAVHRPTRAERAAQIERLDRRGLDTNEIAEQLGLARSTVNIYRRDPDGSRHRQRLAGYLGRCDDCGRPTSGSGGRARAPARCRRCAGARRRLWPGELILRRIREWTAETGSPPRVRDWSPAHASAGHPGTARYVAERGHWPSASAVVARFGSFPAAVRRAGVTPSGPASGSRRVWTRGRIVEAMQRWYGERRRFPTRSDWQKASDWHPAASTVYRVFGSWKAALKAARLKAGRRRIP